MEIRSLGFRTDIALLQRTGSEVEDLGSHLVVRTPANPTYFWGNFLLLGRPPFPGGEREVVGAFRTEFPDARHVSIGIDTTDDPGDLQAWRDAGLLVDVATVLTAERLVQPLAPLAQVELRALESDEDWEQRAALSLALSPGNRDESHLAFARARNDQERALVAAGDGARFGGFVDGTLVSTAGIFRVEPGLARFQTVETHPDHRRQGIGASVVHAAGAHAVEALGARSLVIVAETEGEAIRIYRRLGFEDHQRQVMLELRPPEWADA
ncbi:MAG: GNAT family N-acetyltransferase [Nocardioides sp.]|nr:GNAT family N-acetyltransferase [Nocardioides sp.]